MNEGLWKFRLPYDSYGKIDYRIKPKWCVVIKLKYGGIKKCYFYTRWFAQRCAKTNKGRLQAMPKY